MSEDQQPSEVYVDELADINHNQQNFDKIEDICKRFEKYLAEKSTNPEEPIHNHLSDDDIAWCALSLYTLCEGALQLQKGMKQENQN